MWRAGGAIALYANRGHDVTVVCLAYGERGESARLWRQGMDLEQVKEARHAEAEAAAKVLGADLRAFDADDYPLVETPELLDRLVRVYREIRPTLVLTHSERDPWNRDHESAHSIATEARIIAQAAGYDPGTEVIGAPPVFLFEPHQTEYCRLQARRAPRHHRGVGSEARSDAVHGGSGTSLGLLHRGGHPTRGPGHAQLGPNLGLVDRCQGGGLPAGLPPGGERAGLRWETQSWCETSSGSTPGSSPSWVPPGWPLFTRQARPVSSTTRSDPSRTGLGSLARR